MANRVAFALQNPAGGILIQMDLIVKKIGMGGKKGDFMIEYQSGG